VTGVAQNLLTNGTFDTGVSSWTLWGGSWDATQNYPRLTDFVSGSALLKTVDVAAIAQCVELPEDQLLFLSFAVKSNGRYDVTVYLYPEPGCKNGGSLGLGLGGGDATDWEIRSGDLYNYAEKSALVTAYAETFDGEQTIAWFDAISLFRDDIFRNAFDP
jgi:hypothetical protein